MVRDEGNADLPAKRQAGQPEGRPVGPACTQVVLGTQTDRQAVLGGQTGEQMPRELNYREK